MPLKNSNKSKELTQQILKAKADCQAAGLRFNPKSNEFIQGQIQAYCPSSWLQPYQPYPWPGNQIRGWSNPNIMYVLKPQKCVLRRPASLRGRPQGVGRCTRGRGRWASSRRRWWRMRLQSQGTINLSESPVHWQFVRPGCCDQGPWRSEEDADTFQCVILLFAPWNSMK